MGLLSDIQKKTRRLEGLMNTKHFGAKRRARHKGAKAKLLAKMSGKETMPF